MTNISTIKIISDRNIIPRSFDKGNMKPNMFMGPHILEALVHVYHDFGGCKNLQGNYHNFDK